MSETDWNLALRIDPSKSTRLFMKKKTKTKQIKLRMAGFGLNLLASVGSPYVFTGGLENSRVAGYISNFHVLGLTTSMLFQWDLSVLQK